MARWKHDKALVRAIVDHDLDGVARALSKGADPNHECTGFGPYTRPLLVSAALGTAEATRVLLESGADREATGLAGQTALHCAIEVEQVAALLAAGADVSARTCTGETPLHLIVRLESCELLLQAGADPFATDGRGNRPDQALEEMAQEAAARGFASPAVIEEGREVVRRLRSIVEQAAMEDDTGPATASPEVQERRREGGRL